MDYNLEKHDVALYMRRLYEKNLTTSSGGNISFRIGKEILITPSAIDKGTLSAAEIAILNIDGSNNTPYLKPSIETELHLSIYRQFPAVKAIIHAHPVVSSTFTALQTPINLRLTAEARAILGQPAVAPYALMGTAQLADNVLKAARKSHVVLMENHGVLARGESLLQAFDRLEVLEAAAKMTVISKIMGGEKLLTDQQIQEIDSLMK